MKGVQEKLDEFTVVGVKPGFMNHDEEGKGSAFEEINQNSFSGKWKIIYFHFLFTVLKICIEDLIWGKLY